MEKGTYYFTKPQYSYKDASVSFFVCYGPQMLNTSIWMVLFESLGHGYNPRYMKPTILAFSVFQSDSF